MEALECIKTRRSVRKFTEEAVSREQMAEVVAAAAYAPSWKNTQTARYNFVTDKEKIARLASDCMMDLPSRAVLSLFFFIIANGRDKCNRYPLSSMIFTKYLRVRGPSNSQK